MWLLDSEFTQETNKMIIESQIYLRLISLKTFLSDPFVICSNLKLNTVSNFLLYKRKELQFSKNGEHS